MDWDLFLFCLFIAAIIVVLVLAYLVSNNKIKGIFKASAKVIVGLSLAGVILFLVVVVAVAAYRSADEAGWFPHERVAAVWMPRDWLVGEFEHCVLASGQTMPVLDCSVDATSTVHEMNVKLRGSLNALESKKQSEWHCQRKEDSITCRAK